MIFYRTKNLHCFSAGFGDGFETSYWIYHLTKETFLLLQDHN